MKELMSVALEDVSVEIYNQLEAEGWQVNTDTFGSPYTPECKTRKVDYSSEGEIERYNVTLNHETFAPMLVENAQVLYDYTIRGVFNEDTKILDLYSVRMIRTLRHTPETIVHENYEFDMDNKVFSNIKE